MKPLPPRPPKQSKDEQLLKQLRASQTFQKYESTYVAHTGLGLALQSLGSGELALYRQRGSTFCTLMAAHHGTCSACRVSQRLLLQNALDSPQSRCCVFSLTEAAAPVRLHSRPIGFLITGQFFRRPQTQSDFERILRKVQALGLDSNPDLVRHAFFQTPVLSPEKQRAMMDFLALAAEHLSLKSAALAEMHDRANPPILVEIKDYIYRNSHRKMPLGEVARAVGLSGFQLCKTFKKLTGRNFSNFVSEVRIARARDLLLDPGSRISEVALAAGFRSVTHFNHVFKHFTGQSPRSYRNRFGSQGN